MTGRDREGERQMTVRTGWMDGWCESEQEIEMDVCRDKRVRYLVINLLVLSHLSVVAEWKELQSVCSLLQ